MAKKLDAIGLAFAAPLAKQVVEQAVDHWRSCANYGSGFPAFFIDDSASASMARQLRIKLVPASGDSKCGVVRGDEITLYNYAILENRQLVRCGDLAQNLAHELGHVLGLNHSPKRSACELDIMSKISRHNASRRSVTREECQSVGQMWWTSAEMARLASLEEGVDPDVPSRFAAGGYPCRRNF